MKTWKKKMKQVVAFLLMMVLMGTNVDMTVLATGVVSGESVDFTEVSTETELNTAIENGENVKLTADIALAEELVIYDSLIVDLNGQTISGPADNHSVYVNASGVIFRDSSMEQTGSIQDGGRAIHIYPGSECTIEGGSYSGMPAISNEGTVVINGGSFYTNNYITTVQNNGNMIVNGGQLYAGSDAALVIYGDSQATIVDCEFLPRLNTNSEPALGDINYRGGTLVLSGTNPPALTLYNDSGSDVAVSSVGDTDAAIQMPTTTHRFMDSNGYSVTTLSNGSRYSFEKIPKQAMWGVSATDSNMSEGDLSEAFSAAASDSSIQYIKLTDSLMGVGYTISGGAFTLDLNGKSVTGAEDTAVFTVTDSATAVTFTDSTSQMAGKVTAFGTDGDCAAVLVENGANVIMEKGTYTGGYAPLMVKENGSATISGGTFDGSDACFATYIGGGKLTISAGAFVGKEIVYNGGVLDLSGVTTSGYEICFWSVPGENQISIPNGYVWFDEYGNIDNEINTDDLLTLVNAEKMVEVSFDANGGSGTMTSVFIEKGDYLLPDCTFTAPDELDFQGWATSADGKIIGNTYNVTEDITFYAIWGKEYDLYVGGVGMEDGDYLACGGTAVSATQPASGGYAYYKDGVLTLKDYIYAGEGYWYDVWEDGAYSCVLYSKKDLEVKLEGENKLANTASDCDGIVIEGNLTISGTGSLELEADYYGIWSMEVYDEETDEYVGGSVIIENGSVRINTNGVGIYAYGDVTVNGGTVNIEAYYSGIYANKKITVNGGYVNIATDADPMYSYEGITWNEDAVELLAPGGGSVFASGKDYYIVDMSGNPASKVVIAPKSTHSWSADYVYNHEAHWHTCTDADCFLAEDSSLYINVDGSAYGVHDVNGENGVCSVCGYNANKEVAVYVGGLGLAEGEYLSNSGRISTTQPATDGYAYYKEGVLTLNNYVYEGAGYEYEENDVYYTAAVYSVVEELKLVLQGENQLINTSMDGDCIYCVGSLVVEGDSISMNAGGDGIDLDGNLVVNSGIVTITTKDDDGIDVDEDVTVTMNGGTLTIHADDKGIDSAGDLIVNGGTLNITSDTDDCADMDGGITIRGGSVTLEADDDGLRADEDILIEGGSITADAGDYGIFTYGDLIINDGEVTLTSDLDTESEGAPAVKVAGEVILGEQVEIQKPAEGTIDTLEEETDTAGVYEYYQIIVDEAGKVATNVVIKGTKENLITAQDKEITYDGNTVDVSELFTIAEDAGEVTYTILESSDGAGTIEDNVLTITKAGNIFIQAQVEANPGFASGSEKAVATLTVAKGEGTASVSIAGWKYKEAASLPVPVSETNGVENVTYFYKEKEATDETYSENVPTGVGEYTLKAVFAETDLYKEVSATADFLLDIAFVDVDRESWQYKGIFYVFRVGLMSGVSDTQFKPNDLLTREQVAMVLYSHAGKPEITFEQKFSDVADGIWYSKAVTWAATQGITAGYPNGTFGVGKNITREEFMVMLYKYAKQAGLVTEAPSGDLNGFADADKVSDWAKEALCWAVENDMLSGKPLSEGGYRIDPQGSTTRAECATILMKFDMKY